MPFHAHLHTVNRHRRLVRHYCFKLGLVWQGLTHDLSKYSPTEFWRSAKYYQGYRSPNDQERLENGVSLSWLHHKGRNRHHFEYWIDYSIEQNAVPMAGVEMPRRYVAEMVMDRIAASKTYNGEAYTVHDPLKYYLRGKHHYMMHPKTAKELEHLLRILDRKGEKVLFAYIRTRYLKESSRA